MMSSILLVLYLFASVTSFHTEGYEFQNDFVDALLLIPNLKFAFCIIPKCGSTMITPILNHLSTYANTSCSVNTWRWSTPECLGMNMNDVVKNVYLDPSWHKAIFYRDPIVRFLSAYTSKCVPGHDPLRLSVKHCVRAFGSWNISLSHALRRLNETKKMNDIHFIPQSNYCGNLTKYFRYYDTKINLDNTSRHEILTLFDKTGMNATTAPKTFFLIDKAFPLQQNSNANVPSNHHITHSAEHVEYFYHNVDDRDLLLNYYKEDVANFNTSVST